MRLIAFPGSDSKDNAAASGGGPATIAAGKLVGAALGTDTSATGAEAGNERLAGTGGVAVGPFAGAGAVGTKRAAREGFKALGAGSGSGLCTGGTALLGTAGAVGAAVAGKGSGMDSIGALGVAIGSNSSLGWLSAVAGRLSASMLPVPLSSQGNEISGKALIIRCTTSKLGLLRSLNMWLITGRPTPIWSAN